MAAASSTGVGGFQCNNTSAYYDGGGGNPNFGVLPGMYDSTNWHLITYTFDNTLTAISSSLQAYLEGWR